MIFVQKARRSGVLRVIYLLGIALILYLFYYYLLPASWAILKYAVPLFTPFYWGILLAALLDPLVEIGTKRLRLGRSWVVLLVLLIFMGAIGLLVTLAILRLVVELTKLTSLIPGYSEVATFYFKDLLISAQSIYDTFNLPPQLVDHIESLINASLNTLSVLSLQMFNWFLSFLSSLPSTMVGLIFTLLATYFFSTDKEKIKVSLYSFFSPKWQDRLDHIGQNLGSAVMGFVRAYAILTGITMLETLAGLLILNVNYAVLVTLAVGIADLLPILGPGTVFLPWAVFLFIQGNNGLAIGLLILYALVMVVRQVMQPKVVASNVGMHPLEALVSIFAGLKIMGLYGLILGPLLWVVLKAAYLAWLWERRKTNA